ncbi:RDD family protein [Candidatus Microgenomates bacterium]|nr:MAG: RDD family protein [Candidatus Microgenomates bacterium]
MDTNITQHNYAGFWLRFKASLIDGLIIVPIVFVFSGYYVFQEQTVQNVIVSEVEGLIATIFMTAYYIIMYAEYNGQTLGKRIAGIKVIMEDGSKITYGKAFLRTITGYTSAAVLFLGYLWVIWSKKKQTWHDKIAQTVVVKV